MLKSGANHWGSLAKFFHWTIVVMILAQGIIGLIMVDLPRRPNIIPVYSFHKSLGLTILALAVLRLIWRAFDRRPREPAGMPRWQAFGARAGHALLYGLLFLVPLSGWWFDSVSALRPLYWFGLFQVPHLGGPDPSIPDLKQVAQARHFWLFWALVVVAAGHAAMALIHQFVHRDGVLRRMWPGRDPKIAPALSPSPLAPMSSSPALETPHAPLADPGTAAVDPTGPASP